MCTLIRIELVRASKLNQEGVGSLCYSLSMCLHPAKGTLEIMDVYSPNSLDQPLFDAVQNLEPGSTGIESGGATTITFRRALVTGDSAQDVDIINADMFLVYVRLCFLF
jgi:hypothetical protein